MKPQSNKPPWTPQPNTEQGRREIRELIEYFKAQGKITVAPTRFQNWQKNKEPKEITL